MKRILLTIAWIVLAWPALTPAQIAGRISPDQKEEIAIDLPGGEHLKNKGGKDGAGLCVFCSIAHGARWQNEEALQDFRDWMTKYPGGGYPEKVARMIDQLAQEKGVPPPAYVQYTGSDSAILKLALRTGRMPCVTYGYSPRYSGRIAHMVNLVHLSEVWACILDNNFPGEDKYEWMTPQEFHKRWVAAGGGWAVILLKAPPPPIPSNAHHGEATTRSGAPKPCEAATRSGAIEQTAKETNYGIDKTKIPSEERYWLNGLPTSPEKVRQALFGGSSLSDDSHKLRLTVIGTKEQCAPILKDLETHAALAPYRGKLLVQAYRPENWAVANVGFPPGQPSILIQAPPDARGKGRVLWRQDDYAGGAEGLFGALRKVDPDYDPKRDPTRRPEPPPAQAIDPSWIYTLIGAGLTVLSWLAYRAGRPILGLILGVAGQRFSPDTQKELDQLKQKLDELLKKFPPTS